MFTCFRRFIQTLLTRLKFTKSVIYAGAFVDKFSVLGSRSVLFNNVILLNSKVGSYSYIQSGSQLINTEIGNFCSVASNVTIGLASHPLHMVSTSPVFYDETQPLPEFMTKNTLFSGISTRTKIASDVWIGYGVIIKGGISIGVGAVIGAGSVVTKDIPPYAVAAGNPCRIIKYRFSEDIINRLLISNWWEKNDIELKSLAHLFIDPSTLLDSLEN